MPHSPDGPFVRLTDRLGYNLAREFAAEVVGLEEYMIPHVQGHHTRGFRLRGESDTLIRSADARRGSP